jgi:hypothetical protein
MVGGKLKYHGRARASTLLEVIISMVIILIVFVISMMISANVMRSSLSTKKLNGQVILQDILIKTERNPEIGDRVFVIDDFSIEQVIRQDLNFPGLLNIHLTAYDGNHEKIADIHKLLIPTNE